MSLEQKSKVVQPGMVENHTPPDEQAEVEQTPTSIKGQIIELIHAATSIEHDIRYENVKGNPTCKRLLNNPMTS